MTDSMPVVTITDDLLEQARELQETRNSGSYVNKNSVNKNPVQDHMIGAIGELIIADWIGADVDWEARYGDDGIDLIHDTGTDAGEITVDVKTTKYRSGSMVMPSDVADEIKTSECKQKPDIYVLVRQQTEYEWEIAGWETADTFLSDSTLCPMLNGGSGENHKLDAEALYNYTAPEDDLDLCRVKQTGGFDFAKPAVA
ncbi:hypothetical protein [Halorubrum sp. GN11GM_10-3_MGM]|uniref:hypothetical protein n=1 Tax=Halorubrum sp. GN11GM_10-3_MGM TaxID=2518111 RepID=UPI0010F8D119|nr:hypothetical protein [Halorubrum sp. GN11GM_10-3_MGM]TKX72188.1 hypothetical protein EXE40_04920 [Halorubrum sp. GN11GM_10-3_MGM]